MKDSGDPYLFIFVFNVKDDFDTVMKADRASRDEHQSAVFLDAARRPASYRNSR
jgi:hypothetical protein